MATNTTTIKFVGQFDSSGITKGLQEIKKQMSNTHIGEDLRKQLETALSKVEANIPALEKMSAKGEFNEKELIAYQKLIQEVSRDMANLSKITTEVDFTKNFSAADNEKLKQFEKQLDDVEKKLKTTRQEILNAFSKTKEGQINGKSNTTLNGFIEQLISVPPDQIEDKLDEIVKDVETQAENTVEKLKQDFAVKANKNKIKKEDFLNLLFGENSGVTLKAGKVLDNDKDTGRIGARTVYNQIREEILALKEDASSDDIKKILDNYHAFIEEYFNIPEGKQSVLANIITPEVIEHLKNLSEHIPELKQALGEEGLKLLAEGEAEKTRIAAEQTTFMKQALDELVESGKITKEQAESVAKALGLLNEQAEKGKNQINAEKAQADALSATFGSLAHRIESAVSAMAIFNKSVQIMRQAIRSVEELDAAFTQIAIVSEQSNESAWKMFDSFNKLAKQYSITTKDLTEGAKLFYQQGLNAADTMKMVEASTISAALGEVTMTEAANTLTAAIQGYNESASVAMDYTDKIAMVGAVSAADFNELSAAMEKTASSAYTAGIDFDHLLGYLGKMIEVTREAPANLGTAMKTIIARFEDMKKDPNALIDGASANKVEAALATIGIALRDTAGEFRPLQEVFDELGQKWQDLTRNQQAYIATVAAGSRQQSRFLAMMNNYDRTLELITESQNSAGAAAEQYAIYQDSIAAAQNRLTASWEKFYSKIVDNSAIKFAINSLSELVEALSHVPPAITAIGASLGALRLQEFIRGTGGKNLLNTIFGEVLKNENGEIEKVGSNIVKKFFEGIRKKGFKELYNDSKKFSTDFPKMIKGVGSSLKELTVDIFKAGEALVAFLAANWQIIAITAAIGGLIYLLHQAAQRTNNLAKEINKLRTEANEKFNTASNLEKLLKTYDDLTSKIVLTEEEQETLNNTIEEIGSSYEGAITYVDKYGNMVLTNTETVKKHTQALKDEAYEMEKNAIKMQREFLNSDRSKWTKENVQNAGFGEYWEQYSSTGGKLGGISSQFLDLTENNEVTIAGIKEGIFGDEIYNDFINLQNSTGIIADDSETIAEYWAEVTAEFGDLTKGYEGILDLMNKEVDIKELKNEIDHDSTLETEQQIAAYKILGKLSDSSLDSWEALKNSLEKSGISLKDFIVTLSKAENSDALFDKIEEFLTGESTEEELKTAFEQAGIESADDFIQAFKDEFASKEEELNKKIQDWADKNGIIVHIEKLDYNEKKLYSELAPLFEEGGDLYKEPAPLNLPGVPTDVANILNSKNKNVGVSEFTLAFEEGDNAEKVQNFLDEIELAIKNKNIETLNDIEQEASKEFNGPLLDIIKLYAEEGKENLIWQFSEADDKIFESYKKAYSIFKDDVGKALSDKDFEFIASTGVDLSPYIEINEEGDQFLSIMGKILLLQKTSNDYEKEILRARSFNLEAIRNIEEELEKIPEEEKKITKENEIQIKQYSKDLANHRKTINLLDERLTKLREIQKAQQKAMLIGSNIAKAKEAYDNVETIGKAYKEALENQGNLSFATAQSLIQMSDFNAEYLQVIDGRIKLTQQGAEAMKNIQREEYEQWLKQENAKLDYQIGLNEVLRDAALELANSETDITGQAAADKLNIVQQQYELQHKDEKEALEKSGTQQEEALKQYVTNWATALQAIQDAANKVFANIATGQEQTFNVQEEVQKGIEGLKPIQVNNPLNFSPVDTSELVDIKDPQEVKNKLTEMAGQYQKNIDSLKKLKELLPSLGDSIEEGFKKGLEGTGSSSKEAEKALKALEKAVKELTDALKDLDDLLIEINHDLKDIDVKYNPFTDLFEAWEHEWDYYYNIKRLIQQIQDQGKYIDGIISADYTSADQKIAAEQAKVGRLLAAMAANDAYIESLRTGMSQTALELMDEFGEYYKINPDTGQLYQHDTSLNQINNTINQRRQEIYELQKLQNEKENDLSLEQAKLDALEQEKSAYENILSTVESQIDSLKNDDDIIANVSKLESEQANIKAKITLTDESIDTVKDVVRNMEDEIQEIEVEITLKDQNLSKLEEYVDKMEDKVSEYEEYWENLNSTIAEQQELLQSITEEYQKYVDTAISTEQDLYNAIIENYQDEINQKKKQYDELKSLDKDYLESVKNNINEERQAREDSNKQKSYQQSLQRAQLLQQDTSGAYRSELAQLNKDIEQQRQDLYDDLVDKQVEALEKEIEKRHELYDKEVAALEERLAYMQENAILLWEMVNNIVAEGSENMMATLENTTAYINSNELAKEKQRKTWEYNVKKTFDGVQNKTIDMLNDLIEAGNEYIKDKLPEVGTAVDEYTQTYEDAAHVIVSYNELLQNNMWSLFGGTGNEGAFQTILNSFMTTWNNTTNTLTGYSESWQAIVEGLRSATEGNIEALRNMNNEGGSIKELDKALRDSAKELYEDFLDERRRYRNELEGLVDTIRTEITAAIQSAADAIRNAANSLQVNPNKDNGGNTTPTSGSQTTQSTIQPTTTTTTTGTKTRYKIQVQGGYLAADGVVHTINETYGGYNSAAAAIEAVRKDLARRREQQKWQNYWHNNLVPIAYAKGGIADYTGPAWLDGTKSKPEAVLNPKQTRLFTSMVNSLEKASNNSNINSPLGSSYNIGDINTTIQVDKLDNQTDINKLARQVEDKIVKDIRNRIPVSVTKGV